MIRSKQVVATYAILAVAVALAVVVAPGGVGLDDSDGDGNSTGIVGPDSSYGASPSPLPSEQVEPLRTVDGTEVYHPDDPGPVVMSEVDRSVTATEYERRAYYDNGTVRNETIRRYGIVVERRTYDAAAIERELEAAIDEARRDHDREPWTWSPVLGSAARKHSDDMAAHDYVGHVGTDGSMSVDRLETVWPQHDCRRVGENAAEAVVGSAFTDPNGTLHDESSPLYVDSNADAADSFVRQWLDSPGHRRLLLAEGGRVAGVGVDMRKGPRGEVIFAYATMVVCFE